jgi:hypothetical protein
VTFEVDLVLGLITLFVAVLAAAFHIRRVPVGDWKELFQQTLRAGPVDGTSRPLQAHWLLVGSSDAGSAVLSELEEQLGDKVVLYAGSDVAVLRSKLEELSAQRSQKLVVVATGEGLPLVVSALVELPQTRDALLAVVSLGGSVATLDAETFTHQKLDVEQGLPVPYFSISLNTDDDGTFPVPTDDEGLERSILSIDLGDVGSVEGASAKAIANALRTTVETVVWAGRS